MIDLAYPQLLWLLLLPYLVYHALPVAGKMYGDALQVPFAPDIAKINSENKYRLRYNTAKALNFFKTLVLILAWSLFVLALCRPQWVGEPHKAKHESRDIMLVVDISPSMLEKDFVYQGRLFSRIAAVKSVVSSFADSRADDRIGLLVFGTRAYQQVPLTYDRQSLKEVLYSIDAGMAGNSTSIGDAVGLALKNLVTDETPVKNKIIVLLTDGENNDGQISFMQATQLAAQEDVKIYTIGMANDYMTLGGLFQFPTGSGLDEEGLKRLAEVTKGNYFRVKDVKSLYAVYDEIDRLEAQNKEGNWIQEKKDLFYYPAALGLLLLLLIILRRN